MYFSEAYIGTENADFSGKSNSSIDESTFEIYNPTEIILDLSEYQIHFDILGNDEGESYSLSGILNPYETTVVSSSTNEEIYYLIKAYYNYPSILDVTSISLKHGLETLDRLGSTNAEESGDPINVVDFISNPSYLAGLVFGVKTLMGLSVRKVGHFQESSPSGYSLGEEFIDQWVPYPVFQSETFGNHLGSCQVPMMYWVDINPFEPEYTFEEFLGVNGQGEFPLDFVSPSIALTETADQDIEIVLFYAPHEYITFSDPSATEDLDYISDDITDERIIRAGDVIFVLDQFAWAIDDAVPEMGEGFAFRLNAVAGGQTIADPDRDVIDFRIVDISSSTVERGENSGLNLYPNVVNSNFRIEADSEKINLLNSKLRIFDSAGRELTDNLHQVSTIQSSIDVNISSSITSGYYNIVLRTKDSKNYSFRIYKK